MLLQKIELQPAWIRRSMLGLLSLLVLLYGIYFSWQSWVVEVETRKRAMASAVELGERAIDTYFLQLEAALKELAVDLVVLDAPIDRGRVLTRLKRFNAVRPELVNVVFMRSDGSILADAEEITNESMQHVVQSASIQSYFKEQHTMDVISLGQPTFSFLNRVWIVPVRYRILDRSGKLRYLLAANLPVQFLESFWKDAPFTKIAAIGILRDDGYFLGRFPTPDNEKNEDIYGRPSTDSLVNYLKSNNYPPKGLFKGVSNLDGQEILNVFHRFKHYPLTLFIVVPFSEMKANWWHKVKIPYLLTALLMASLIAAYVFTARRQSVLNMRHRQMDRLKAEFISVVSHELRTPITSIRGALGLLEGGVAGELSAPALKLIGIANKNSQRLHMLVNDILDMEKLLSGKLSLRNTELDLVQLVMQSLETNAGYGQGLNVSFIFCEHPNTAIVYGDPDRLAQVLANLLSNASKFSAAGQQVDVRILILDDHYRLEIEDRGIGVPMLFLNQIVEIFSQSNSSDAFQKSGAGLGLSITKGLVENMGGKIGFDAEEGMGYTFWFELPKATDASNSDHSAAFNL
jgi:signal transduction histidine kinase